MISLVVRNFQPRRLFVDDFALSSFQAEVGRIKDYQMMRLPFKCQPFGQLVMHDVVKVFRVKSHWEHTTQRK